MTKVDSPLNSAVEVTSADDNTRRAAYRSLANDRLREARRHRATDLAARRVAVEKAIASYSRLRTTPERLRIRSSFIELRRSRQLPPNEGGTLWSAGADEAQRRRIERDSRPPATRLIAQRSSALPTWLAMLFVAQCEATRGRFSNEFGIALSSHGTSDSWATLCGRAGAEIRARRARMRRDLDHLSTVGMIQLPRAHRYEHFSLLCEDGSGRSYTVPKLTDAHITLPANFFMNGWHIVLAPDEVAMYLALTHLRARVEPHAGMQGVALPYVVRFGDYGISSECYDAVHELDEFGLLKVHDPMPHRRRGKINRVADAHQAAGRDESLAPVPYEFELTPEGFDLPALEVVTSSLSRHPLPPRVTNAADFLTEMLGQV